jgi:hypothetical protein
VPPTASFVWACNVAFLVDFDGIGSTSASGTTITGYSWSFGDTVATTSFQYADATPVSVTLTVTASDGLTDSISHTVTPCP